MHGPSPVLGELGRGCGCLVEWFHAVMQFRLLVIKTSMRAAWTCNYLNSLRISFLSRWGSICTALPAASTPPNVILFLLCCFTLVFSSETSIISTVEEKHPGNEAAKPGVRLSLLVAMRLGAASLIF